jgi:hypothetical protein
MPRLFSDQQRPNFVRKLVLSVHSLETCLTIDICVGHALDVPLSSGRRRSAVFPLGQYP